MSISLYLIILTLHTSPVNPAPGIFPSVYLPGYQYDLLFEQVEKPAGDEKPQDKWFAMDKFWHWAMSFSLTGSTYHLTYVRLQQDQMTATVETLSFTLFCGILKEFYDLYTQGLFSYKDIIYDLLGIASGYFVFIHNPDTSLF